MKWWLMLSVLLLLPSSWCFAGDVPGGGDPVIAGEVIATGLANPIDVVSVAGDTDRLFVLERPGRVRIIRNGQVLSTPFLDISALVSTSGERGLLGMAFHPDYASNGQFFVRYSNLNGESVIARYVVSANPDVADANSAHVVMAFNQSVIIHVGGAIQFGPDGLLYVTVGDASFSAAAQDTDSRLGKILRIDVDGDDFPEDETRNYAIPSGNPFGNEVWAYGLRNPYRSSIDQETGNVWIADVGQGNREEVNFHPPGNGGRNFGWPCMEGTACYPGSGCVCNDPSLTRPVFEYTHTLGCAIIGGHVYRGCAIPSLYGAYMCADYCSGRVWTFFSNGVNVADVRQRQNEINATLPTSMSSIVGIGQDAQGELYICEHGGRIVKIVPVQFDPANCAPDSIPGDVTGDQQVNVDDLLAVISNWGPCPAKPTTCPADMAPWPDGDEQVNVDDLLLVISNWGT